MIKMKNIAMVLSLTICMGVAAQTREINPMTQAMLDSYGELLAANPDDYFTLYQRSAQYYHLSMYDEALTDIKKAISCTPAKEKDMLATEYQLAAEIYTEIGEYSLALETIDKALAYNPDDYPLLYQKGNICLYLGNPGDAKICFSKMQRLQSRSQEAFFGLARVAIMQGDTEQARQLMTEAENVNPSSYITYCRLGDLCREAGDYDKAAAYYLSGFGLADGQGRPVSSLIDLAASQYPSVANAIDYALSKTVNRLPLYFLKGNIALKYNKLEDAYAAFSKLLEMPEGKTASVYSAQALVCHYLNNQPEALDAVSKAVIESPTTANLTLKSKIERASGQAEVAVSDALLAYTNDPGNPDAALELALAYIGVKNVDKAVETLDALLSDNPENVRALMVRAYLNNHLAFNPSASVGDYMRVARMEAVTPEQRAMKAMAQTLNGKKLDGDDTAAALLAESAGDANAMYWCAVYYSQTGDLEKAVECLAKCQQLGYENDYNIWDNKDANLNVDPIRYLMKK